MWTTTLFAVAITPLLISSIVASIITGFYFALREKDGDQTRRG